MTASAPNPLKPELQGWFDTWTQCVQDVLSQVSGQPTAFESVPESLAAGESDLRFIVTATGAVSGEMSLRVAPASALRLARKLLGEPEPPPAEAAAPETVSAENREALEELLRQIAGLGATAIGGKVGGQVQLQLARADADPAWSPESVAVVRTRNEAGIEIAIEAALSPPLAAALAERAKTVAAAASASPAAPSPTSDPAPASMPEPAPDPAAPSDSFDPATARYQRLLEVGLGVKLRFGTRRMLLRDVLALSSGLVVELDNKLSSPVDLLLDGRVIARGEVVVVDGKYGLRVTDVVDAPTAPPV